MAKPKYLKLPGEKSNGFAVYNDKETDYRDLVILQVTEAWFAKPNELRRIAKWLNQAADWLERKDASARKRWKSREGDSGY